MFIPDSTYGVSIGDRVRAIKPVRVENGVFTEGHLFKVVNITSNGPVLQDSNMMGCKTGVNFRDFFVKV